jgi:ABC-2 type transport system permease protein
MRAYRTLVRRELSSHFYSWTGYVVMSAVLFLLGFSFSSMLEALSAESTPVPITEIFFDSYYFWTILLLVSPIITMRSLAQEKSSGTFETLMTTPVSDLQVVLAKFTGALLFYMLLWIPLMGCIYIVRRYSDDPNLLDVGTLISTYLGIFLIGSVFMAMGCFASALTRSQIIAAMVAFVSGISLFYLGILAMGSTGQAGWKAQLISYLGLIEHMRDFARGVVDTRPVVFYLSLTFFFLFLTHKTVESRRWK